MLTSRIKLPTPSTPSQEDIFSSALSSLFTDDTQNSHGSPGGSLTYTSPVFGDIELQIPAHPDVEEGRKLFAHYLWNASLVVAEGIECASVGVGVDGDKNGQTDGRGRGGWNSRWNVRERRVLELGAGTALPSIISTLCGASNVTITDHPSSPALTNGAIQASIAKNLNVEARKKVEVCGYVWGTETTYTADAYGKVTGKLGTYERIVLADCLWMPSQHANLVRTVGQALGEGNDCCAIVVAGFHTGREVVRDFFDVATGGRAGGDVAEGDRVDGGKVSDVGEGKQLLKLKVEEIFEIDVNGRRREWERAKPGEGKEEAKKWCVVAILVRPQTYEDTEN